MLNGLIIGDVVGKPALDFLISKLDDLKTFYKIDFIIVNGENAAGGKGITTRMADDLKTAGVNVITSGNHIWQAKSKDVLTTHFGYVLRPQNYPNSNEGTGHTVFQIKGNKIAVINAIGRSFMPDAVENPFYSLDATIEKLRAETNTIIMDFHGETTAEKIAYGRYLDGKVSCVVGTHTHVQTADERVLPKGTAYITDLGMTGPVDSVIGMKVELAIKRFRKASPTNYELASSNQQINGVVVSIDEKTGKADSIQRVQITE
jgi:metallophosphoesterase (TIGR00282 family)